MDCLDETWGVRGMKKLTIALALVSLFAVGLLPNIGRSQKVGEVLTLGKGQWREDLQYLARELPKRHKNLFHTVSREQFERAVAELDTPIPSLEDHQIIVRMLQITAMIGDAHTYVHLPQTFKLYPVALYWFGGDLRVLRAAPENKQALGAKVVKVGGMNISDVQTRLVKVLSQSENEWFVLSNSPGYMAHPEVLQTLGIVPDVGRVPFTFDDEQGKQFALDITPVVADASLNSLWLSENVRKLFQFVDSNITRRLVIDMRQNGGGDFTKVRSSLLPAIKQRPTINQKRHLFVIIGRRTFSAAMTNAIDFRKETNAILVGEPAGERPNSYQENDEMKLPNSGLVVSYSTKYYKFLDEDAPAVMPDKRIDPNWLDFKAGRDPVMDWILSQSN